MPLDRAAVAHIATLARIKVPESDLDAMAKELDGILHWVEQLKEVDTANVEPMTGAVRMALPRRKDEITEAVKSHVVIGGDVQSLSHEDD